MSRGGSSTFIFEGGLGGRSLQKGAGHPKNFVESHMYNYEVVEIRLKLACNH